MGFSCFFYDLPTPEKIDLKNMKPLTFDSPMPAECGVSKQKLLGRKTEKKTGTRYKFPRGVSFFPSGLKIPYRLLPRSERKYFVAVDRTPSP